MQLTAVHINVVLITEYWRWPCDQFSKLFDYPTSVPFSLELLYPISESTLSLTLRKLITYMAALVSGLVLPAGGGNLLARQ